MATIVKRKRNDGTTAYRVQIRRSGLSTISKTFSTLRAAKAYSRRLEGDLESGRASPKLRGAKKTVTHVLDRYQEYLDSPNCVLKAPQGRGNHLKWWRKRLGSVRLSDLDPSLIADAVHQLERENAATKKGVRSPATVNRYLATLSAAMKMAVRRWRWIDRNPVKDLERSTESNRRTRILRGGEWDTLLQACKKHKNRFLHHYVTMALFTGARRSELRWLRWDHVDVERHTAVLDDTKSGESREIVFVGPAAESLKDLQKMRVESSPYIFPGHQFQRPMAFDKPFAEARETAGLNDGEFVFHSLRHTCLTWLGETGASAFEVQAVSGHKTLSQAARYTHLRTEHAEKALLRLIDRHEAQ